MTWLCQRTLWETSKDTFHLLRTCSRMRRLQRNQKPSEPLTQLNPVGKTVLRMQRTLPENRTVALRTARSHRFYLFASGITHQQHFQNQKNKKFKTYKTIFAMLTTVIIRWNTLLFNWGHHSESISLTWAGLLNQLGMQGNCSFRPGVLALVVVFHESASAFLFKRMIQI